ncbi:MAG TPA: sulfite exporter TauE/SafE family protein [Planctomycetota bacterium]|nr:sulfite exporter TauE/SafE family protein [Planctomycetota bacterium]
MIWPHIEPDVTPWVYYVCVAAAVLITGISKSGFGGGIGIVAIPIMASVMPARHMLGVQLPLLIAADALSNLHHLRNYEWRILKPLVWGALVGVLCGSALFWELRNSDPARLQRGLSLLIGGICLLFVAIQVLGLLGRRVPTLPSHPVSSLTVGMTAGFVSTLSHGAGPLVTLYLLQEKLARHILVGTQVFYFLLVNTAKVPTYVALHYINRDTLRDSIWFIPLIPLGTLAGAWMNKRIPEKPFAAILYVAAAVTAGHMIWKSLR